MDPVILARWQFGITTVYHFLFVPITLGLSWLVAIMQTIWYRTGNDSWLRLTKFFGKLMLINFAAGVVTGIVQEFQFGMNWSEYSRFVGDIFGAPLALEALIAFFLESTFIGVWIFGWDRIPRRVHLAMIYIVAASSTLSAIFILAANSWMQNPVGAVYRNGRAELANFADIFTNPFFLTAFPHQIAAAFIVSGGLVAGIAGWWLAKHSRTQAAAIAAGQPSARLDDLGLSGGAVAVQTKDDRGVWRSAAKLGAWTMLIASVAVVITGDMQGKVEAQLQPMKLAASEGLFETTKGAPLSLVAIFTPDGSRVVWSLDVPYMLSILAHNDPNATVQGIIDLREQYETGGWATNDGTRNPLQEDQVAALLQMDIDQVPNVWVSFYSFRLMIGVGLSGALLALLLLVLLWKEKIPRQNKWWTLLMLGMPLLPLVANSFGWILTEMGRQPWVVMGVLPTQMAVSPNVSAGEVAFSMGMFTLVYGTIAAVVVKLFLSWIRAGLAEVVAPEAVAEDEDAPVYFAY